MTISTNQGNYLESVITAFELDPGPLNDWEKGFMKNQSERFEQYGNDIFMSPKQWGVINKIADAYGIEKP